MREILFRGKRLDDDKWIEGYFYKIWDKVFLLWGMTGDSPNMEEVTHETIGQYTGLTDKNGKKIFEGDIIKTKEFGKDSGNCVNFNNFDIFEVIYSSASFKLNNSRRLFNMLKGQEFEVIGNIHDNKELLGE